MLKLLSKFLLPFATLAAGLSATVPAYADSFQGTIWTLYSLGLQADADPAHETYRIKLGVDTNGYSGSGLYLDQVAIKVSSSIVSASLVSAPGGASSWALLSGGISASGCSGSGSGFECANSLSALNGGKGVSINPGNGVGVDYSWTFDITANNGAFFLNPLIGTPSVKARFVDAYGRKSGALVSEPLGFATPVPEPETYAMLLAGIGLMSTIARRRRKA